MTAMRKTTKPALTRAGILKALREHDEELKKYSVKRIGLFGSYARGEQKRGSDIDFLVEFETPTYDNFYDLIVYLEKLFGRKVEVLTPDGVDSIRVPEVAQSIRDSVVYV
jgi:predicted nucleotidyltransferase